MVSTVTGDVMVVLSVEEEEKNLILALVLVIVRTEEEEENRSLLALSETNRSIVEGGACVAKSVLES